jgi:hypothetical protein
VFHPQEGDSKDILIKQIKCLKIMSKSACLQQTDKGHKLSVFTNLIIIRIVVFGLEGAALIEDNYYSI